MNISLTNNQLCIDLEWYEQVWAFTLQKTLTIPLAHIEAISDEEPQTTWQEIRAPGTFIPGVIKAGTYYTKRGKEFWYVTKEKDYLTIQLIEEPYNRIILTPENSHFWLQRIRENLNL